MSQRSVRSAAVAAALLLVLSCTSHTPSRRASVTASPAPAAQPAPAARAPLTAPAKAQRVILLSFDGMGADALAAHMPLPSFARLAAEGTRAVRVIPVNPTVTSTTHAAILTGTGPELNGIVANRFHKPGTAPDVVTKGMESDVDGETLVETARRQGKRVGCIVFPTVDGTSPRRSADWGIAFTGRLTKPRIVKLTRGDFHAEWVPPTWTSRPQRRVSYSPPMRARLDWIVPAVTRADVDVVAYDTTNDRTRNYDSLYVEMNEREIALDAKGWFPLSAQTQSGVYGSWSKVLTADRELSSITIYWGSIARNDAYPATFQTFIDQEAGFWPGAPDEESAAEWLAGREGIDAQTFSEQLERFASFLTRASAAAIERMPFDLLLLYQPTIDEAQHQFLVVRETQANGTERNRTAGANVIRSAFRAADQTIGTLLPLLDKNRDALIVTGDHGVGAIDAELRLNTLLTEWGYTPRWTAFASGNVAHLYRFGGIDDTDVLIGRLQGSGYFERVERKGSTAHANSGDVIAYSHPQIAMNAAPLNPVLVKPSYYGQHGALNTHPEFHTALFAWGAGVPVKTIPQMQQTEIAGYVSALLGIEAPRH